MDGFANCNQDGIEYASGNIYLRPVHLIKAGDSVQGHQHYFDHTTFVVKGSVHVAAVSHLNCRNAERKTKDFTAGQHFLVKANWHHFIKALEDDTRFVCIYSHRTPQGEVVQEYDGWIQAHACVAK